MEDEAVPHRPDLDAVISLTQSLNGFQLAILPCALDELKDQHLLSISPGADRRPKGRRSFSFTGSRIDQDQSFLYRHRFALIKSIHDASASAVPPKSTLPHRKVRTSR